MSDFLSPYRNQQDRNQKLKAGLKYTAVASICPKRMGLVNHGSNQEIVMAWMYILRCCDNSHYIGSTKILTFVSYNINKERKKQVQDWTRRKREALINGHPEFLPVLTKKVFDKSKIKNNFVVEEGE